MLPHGERIAEAVETAGLPVVLIGHFAGAAAAVRCARTRSGLAALVLVSPVPGMWDDEPPTLRLHGSGDEMVPTADTRAGTDRIRGSRFEEHVVPGLLTDGEVVTQVLEFARRVV
ncbi:hypothetical protein SAMN04488000_101616 [Lentzea albida]|uniref:Alpha/beta hydrolase family protein n=1 Tax=Lentzea albida TaxID=65499 RepID=A0A1H9BQ62_9PSEU|nr:hypothetical protein SAMN04488000_101616 [Lentzea albida]